MVSKSKKDDPKQQKQDARAAALRENLKKRKPVAKKKPAQGLSPADTTPS